MTATATSTELVCVDGPAACSGAVQLHWLTFDTERRLRCRAHAEAFQARTGGEAADLAPEHCIDGPEGCAGHIELRWPGFGQRNYARCQHHGDLRLADEQAARARYPDQRPADFSELDAGERWDED